MTCRSVLFAVLIIPAVLVLVGCAQPAGSVSTGPSPSAAPATNAQETAAAVVQSLASGDTAAVIAKFDDTMKAALPAAQLSQVWNDVVAQKGALKRQAGIKVDKIQGFDVAFVTCEFERGTMVVQVTLDNAGKVSGLFVRPG